MIELKDYLICPVCETIFYKDETHNCPDLTVMKHIEYVPRINEQQKESNEQDS